MYFNDKPKETNYDSEFSKKINFLNFKLLAIIGIVIFIIIIMIIFFLINKKEYFIKLNGETDIVLYVGNDYVEPGYVAYDSKGKEYDASLVTIDGAVNPNVAGEYVLTYKFKEKSAERIVTVLSKQDKVTILGLYGDTIIFVPLGQEFKEPGYYAIDSDYSNEEIKNKVDVSGEVNINKVGTYHIIYKLENDMGITITKERIVIVTSADFALEYEPKTLTNKNVKIYGYITNNYFDYILLPNGKKENNRNFSYIVDKNGKYTFKVFLKDGTNHDETVDISNIDTTKPTGICAAVVKNSTTIEVNAQDDKEILGYRYKLDGYSTGVIGKNSYTYSGTTQNVSVEVHDKAGNVTNITCNVKIEQSSVIPSPPSQGPVPSVIRPSSKISTGGLSSNQRFIENEKAFCKNQFDNVAAYHLINTKNNVKTFADKLLDLGVFELYPPGYSGNCLSFAIYHSYMLYAGTPEQVNNMTAADAAVYNYSTKFKSVYYVSERAMMSEVYNLLNKNQPVIIHVNGNAAGTSRHFVTVVGYKNSVTSGTTMSQKDLLIIDNYDGCLEPMDRSFSRFLITGYATGRDHGYRALVLK